LSLSRRQAAALTVFRRPADRADGPTFPSPWAARAFALSAAAQQRGVFTLGEWASELGNALARQPLAEALNPDAYWHAWLAALEGLLVEKGVAAAGELARLRDAWRAAAEATPHGEPIELPRQV
jgi:nitrile hydratase accessory protein